MDKYKLDIERVRRLAFNKGLSLSGLCEKAGMNRSRATEWKDRPVTPKTVYRIAEVLGCIPSELVTEEGDTDEA